MPQPTSAAYRYTEVGPLIYDGVRYEVVTLASKRSFMHEARVKASTIDAAQLLGAVGQAAEFVRNGRTLPVKIVSVEPHYQTVQDSDDDRPSMVVYFSYAI